MSHHTRCSVLRTCNCLVLQPIFDYDSNDNNINNNDDDDDGDDDNRI